MGQAVGFGLDSAEGENHQEMVGLGDLSGSGVAAGLEVARRSLRPAHPSAQSSMQCLLGSAGLVVTGRQCPCPNGADVLVEGDRPCASKRAEPTCHRML